jgi:lipopolysaccharide export system permease protein
MLQNKIYHNFLIEILKTFFVILLGLSLVALTVRAVNFLDLIVDSGYPISIYFKYSFLNAFGVSIKFIPLSFLIALIVFILKHINDSEFVILWTSGVKKTQVVNLFFFLSIIILIFYLIFSTYLTPIALNKSRNLLAKEDLNSFLPTVKSQQFSDSYKGFTFIVEKKKDKQLKNIFLHDKNNNLKNFSSNVSNDTHTTVIAKNGLVRKKKMILFNGSLISSKINDDETDVIKFEQLTIDLNSFKTTIIKNPKLQETSTIKLFECFTKNNLKKNSSICTKEYIKEVIPTLNRRLVLPLYIPVLSLICSLLLINTKKKYFNNVSVFLYGFLILLFTELTVRYTGINIISRLAFVLLPFVLLIIFYSLLIFNFSRETKKI